MNSFWDTIRHTYQESARKRSRDSSRDSFRDSSRSFIRDTYLPGRTPCRNSGELLEESLHELMHHFRLEEPGTLKRAPVGDLKETSGDIPEEFQNESLQESRQEVVLESHKEFQEESR